LLIARINGQPVGAHFLARFLLDAGFHAAPNGFNVRRAPTLALGGEAEASAEMQ
jgi:ATP-dependent Lhr-like helicase